MEVNFIHQPLELPVDITVSDINPDMLEVGRKRAQERGSFQGKFINLMLYLDLKFLELNAEKLDPLESDSYDLYTIAFGIRNVTNRENALKEAHRVLRRGGRFMCLEFSEVEVPGFKQIYDMYSFNMIPLMGQYIANDRDSY